MADTNQELYEKLQKYLQLKKELEEDIKSAEQWLKEADKEKDKTAIEVAQWSLERNQLILEAVELAISDITTFLNEQWAEIRGDYL
jgi:formiminotetrahydrofolate cyclodeaminase